MAKAIVVSLGCAKNQVNSEQMLHLLSEAGYTLVGRPEEADVAVVNTCGFIESAKSEAIDHILELDRYRAAGNPARILVAGCLSQRYGAEILAEMPEVDGVLGTGSYGQIVPAVERALAGERVALFGDIDAPVEETERVLLSPKPWAYLKIAEGCDNRCAYCVIPALRGKYRSRPMEHIIAEAEALAAAGVRELIVVAQDITRYGTDLYGERRLAELVRALAGIPGLKWIRLHYLYPDAIDDALIQVIQEETAVLPYLDIPIQHINDTLLSAMNRRGTGGEIRALLKKLRAALPDLVLRTSLIVGLPGEGEAEFQELVTFLQETAIQRAGVFPYSPEEGTAAAEMPGRPEAAVASARAERLMALQMDVMEQFTRSRIGRAETVLCEGREGDRFYGRSYAESPEVDGVVWIRGEDLAPGTFYTVRYVEEVDGELEGVVLSEEGV